ncbi:hypothetical protein NDK43_06800 [Neobacillus pocheonensis]|uniref:Uncharacterized protein n=1 Tax=Neobacillus pocheonensis TaxID=363869 RepID=A0ABT0W761_9BACI|nr:hypothetical protein [Neobacillus pocheonensis]
MTLKIDSIRFINIKWLLVGISLIVGILSYMYLFRGVVVDNVYDSSHISIKNYSIFPTTLEIMPQTQFHDGNGDWSDDYEYPITITLKPEEKMYKEIDNNYDERSGDHTRFKVEVK